MHLAPTKHHNPMDQKQPVLIFLFGILLLPSLFAQLPKDFYDQLFLDGFDFPMGIEFDERGYGYVWEKRGVVWVIDSTGKKLAEPLIDISEEVTNWKDHGLTGFALDPGFANNGRFYLLYALDLHYYDQYGTPNYDPDSTVTWQASIGRVARYEATAALELTRADTSTRKLLLGENIDNGIPLLYTFHGLGDLLTAEDGTLLISCGDATSNGGTDTGGDSHGTLVTEAIERGILRPDEDVGSYKAQYLGSYSGKILRIDGETGDGLPSNPFYDPESPRSAQSRTWAMGFRNPYRIVLRPESGSHFAEEGNPGIIYAGDVGNGAWEEIDIVTEGGQNFGWPITEGTWTSYAFYIADRPPNRLAPNPLYQAGGCDQEFFSFYDLMVRAAPNPPPAKGNPCDGTQPIPTGVYPTQEKLPAITWSNRRWNPPTRAIVPYFDEEGKVEDMPIDSSASPVSGELFDGFSSLAGVFYPEGGPFPEAYHGKYFGVDFSGWIRLFDFDENDTLHGVEPFHNAADNIIHLTINPTNGTLYYVNLDGDIRQISYGGNPPPVAVINADTLYGPGPLTVQFDATQSYDPDTRLTAYHWDFGDGTTSDEVAPRHIFESSGAGPAGYTVRLTVTDSLGLSHTAETVVSLNNTPPRVAISSFRDGDRYPLDGTSLLVLEADVSDREHSDTELEYAWQVFLHHNDHYHPEVPVDDRRTYTLISPLGCREELYWYRIKLTVTDAAGLSSTDTRRIYPYCGDSFVEFTTLKGQTTASFNELSWETTLEDSLSHFVIQRSRDFYDFETIAEIPAGLLTSTGQSYSFTDETPLRGNNIYRIKAVRRGSGYTYSNLLTLPFPAPPDVLLNPNPAGNQFQLTLRRPQSESVRFELFNANGQRLLSTNWPATPGQKLERTILTANWTDGAYFYRLLDGEREFGGRLIIQR